MITQIERESRLAKLNEQMHQLGLRAALLIGDGSVALRDYGHYRYFVDNRVYYNRQILVAVADEHPTVCCGSPTHLMALRSRGFQDVKMVGDALIEGVIEILTQRGITSGQVGYCPQTMPAGWYRMLRAALPQLQLVDCGREIYQLRMEKTRQEQEIAQKCAAIADAGYAHCCQVIREGMTEGELVAELDYAMKKLGAEETFSLMTSGHFSADEKNELGWLHNAANSPRVLKRGDCVAMEITPRYEGYWSQMVRTICVGEPSADAEEMRAAVEGCIESVLPLLRPGVPVRAVAEAIEAYAKANGYRAMLPCGHICGVDLNEYRLDASLDVPMTEGMSVILHPTLLKEGMKTGLFWGQCYTVTPEGGKCLMASSRELITAQGGAEE